MKEVKDMLKDDYGIVRKPITTQNPQANAIVERAHQTPHQMIRTHRFQHKDHIDMEDPLAGLLSAVGFAMCSTVSTTTRATPAQLVFNCNMILNVGFKADWQYIKEWLQAEAYPSKQQT